MFFSEGMLCKEIYFIVCDVETATPSQSLMILRCCGSLVPDELPEKRTILVKKIWDTLNYIGMILIIDLSHLNRIVMHDYYVFRSSF